MKPFMAQPTKLKMINVDNYVFSVYREEDYMYVDKTAYFYKLIFSGNRLFFISRPRRFGKSMMISTLESIFQGKREFFKGLAIDSLPYDWKKYPVIHFDFSGVEYTSLDNFRRSLARIVRSSLSDAGCTFDNDDSPSGNFNDALRFLKNKYPQGVVVLIDEYDAPIAHALHKPKLAENIREELAQLYIQLKRNVSCLRFLMVTGVSKFAQMSVFSALNNIVDLTMDPDYATMLGYTEEELEEYFGDHMQVHAEKMGKSYEEYREEFRHWYNGYRFSLRCEEKVYNPVAVALTLERKYENFGPTWTTTGHTATLINYIKANELPETDYENIKNVSGSVFNSFSVESIDAVGLLYQTGYLTIKDYNSASDLYTLGVPDEEVKRDLYLVLASAFSKKSASFIGGIGADLKTFNWDKFKEDLASYYAGMVYGPKENIQEANFQRLLMAALSGGGLSYRAEVGQSAGRADIVVEHALAFYIFELKVDEPAESAIAQIKEKGYAAPYIAKAKEKNIPIYAIGLSFSKEKRILLDCQVERII